MKNVWAEGSSAMTHRQRIEYWCRFDSEVGFGNFTIKEHRLGDVEKGIISIMNNFLASPTSDNLAPRKDHTDLCPLIVGYVKGVLSAILEVSEDKVLNMEHPKRLCITHEHGRTACDILFTIQMKG